MDQTQKQATISRSQALAANSQLQKSKNVLSLLLALESFRTVAHLPDSERPASPEQVVRDSLSPVNRPAANASAADKEDIKAEVKEI